MPYEVGLALLDLDPISTRTISRRVADPEGIPIPDAAMCQACFDDIGSTLVAITNADCKGPFDLILWAVVAIGSSFTLRVCGRRGSESEAITLRCYPRSRQLIRMDMPKM
jgi:hypothetical protein